MQRLRRPGRGWFHLRVVLFAAFATSAGLAAAENRINPGWPGWTTVRYVVGSVFVLGLLIYVVWLWRRHRGKEMV